MKSKTKKEREKGKGKKENGEKIAVVLKCPKCGQGEIVKGKTAWGCTLYRKSCDFLIPMDQLAEMNPEQIAAFKAAKGLDGPMITRYFSWLRGVCTGDPRTKSKKLPSPMPTDTNFSVRRVNTKLSTSSNV